MKTKVIVKTLLDIMLFIAGATLLEAITSAFVVFIKGFPNFLLSEDTLTNHPEKIKIHVVLALCSQVLFFISIFFLRKMAQIYQDQKSFYQAQILKYLSVAGWCLLVYSGLELIVKGIQAMIDIDTLNLSGISFTQKSMLVAILAILLIRLAKIFKKTVEEKKENEYTI